MLSEKVVILAKAGIQSFHAFRLPSTSRRPIKPEDDKY